MKHSIALLAAMTVGLVAAGSAQATTFVQYDLSGSMTGTRNVQPMTGAGYTETVTGRATFTYLLPLATTSATIFQGYFTGSIGQLAITPTSFTYSDTGKAIGNINGNVTVSACLLAWSASCSGASISDSGSNYSLNLTGSIDGLTTSIRNAVSPSYGLIGYTFTANAVPEPTTWATMVLGFGLLAAALRRRGRPAGAFA